jgi:hypothetical protein
VFIAGSVAGLVSWTSTFPFDLIKVSLHTRLLSILNRTSSSDSSLVRFPCSQDSRPVRPLANARRAKICLERDLERYQSKLQRGWDADLL